MSIRSALTDNVFPPITSCSSKKGAHSRRRKWCCSQAAAAAAAATKAATRPRTADGSSVPSDLLREFSVNYDITSCGCVQRRQLKGLKQIKLGIVYALQSVSSIMLMSSKLWKWVKSMSGGESLHGPSHLKGPQQDHRPCWCGGLSPGVPRLQVWRQEQL